jgi:hypothetical protein
MLSWTILQGELDSEMAAYSLQIAMGPREK